MGITSSITTDCHQISQNFAALADLAPEIARAAVCLQQAALARRLILFCGNGGSAADAQHLAAELTGRYLRDREPLPAMALTVDSSALTAIGNDYGFEQVFSRQLRGVGRAGDVLVALSTSGNSPNVLAALQTARTIGIATIGLTGHSGGQMRDLCDICLMAPAQRPDRVQEMHIAIGHMLCGFVESVI